MSQHRHTTRSCDLKYDLAKRSHSPKWKVSVSKPHLSHDFKLVGLDDRRRPGVDVLFAMSRMLASPSQSDRQETIPWPEAGSVDLLVRDLF